MKTITVAVLIVWLCLLGRLNASPVPEHLFPKNTFEAGKKFYWGEYLLRISAIDVSETWGRRYIVVFTDNTMFGIHPITYEEVCTILKLNPQKAPASFK